MELNIYTTFETSLYNSLVAIFSELNTDCKVIFANQNGPEPKGTYCTINAVNITPIGMAQTDNGLLQFVGGSLPQYSTRQYETISTLTFYGSSSANVAMDLFSQMSGNTRVTECLLRQKLAQRRTSAFRRSPQLRETTWVDSYAFDITLGWAVQTAQNMDWADYTRINGNLVPLNPP